jgi:hypothetical protein
MPSPSLGSGRAGGFSSAEKFLPVAEISFLSSQPTPDT